MFLNRRRDLMQQLIDNPPQTSAQLDEIIALHMRVSMCLKMMVIVFGAAREEIEEDLGLLKQLWALIEVGLQADFPEDALPMTLTSEDGTNGVIVRRLPEGERLPIEASVLHSTFVPGNTTTH